MIRAIAIDTSALDRLQGGFDFDVDWFRSWSDENLPSDIARIEINDVVYLLGPDAESDSRLLVINLDQSGLFDQLAAKHRPEAFFRLIRLGRSAHESGRTPIPTSWSPYHHGSLISIQSNHLGSGEKARIEIDLNPNGRPHTYAYILDKTRRDLRNVTVPYYSLQLALSHYEDAVIEMLSRPTDKQQSNSARVVLGQLEDRVSLGRSLDDWLGGNLTKAQLEFVNAPLERSIRLVGAAGTGKTLSLAIRCLIEFRKRSKSTAGYRCLFLTHSQSTVETVLNSLTSLDHEGITSSGQTNSLLKVCTLQELANDAMKYDLHGLEPLSNDGLEGRVLQIEAIESQVESFKSGDWITYRERCSEGFRMALEAARGSPEARTFAFEIMNEFACVLEADGVRQSAERRDKYINEERKSWMMPLPNTEDRRVVLSLYDRFRSFLKELGVIGVDQMISDYLGYLDSNRWDNIRQREGFDTVFVDELHLFNRQERMTFHHLMRDSSRPPTVVMAYDSKQSVKDTFYGLAEHQNGTTIFSRDMRLGQTERFELTEAFRYSPEIARLLEWIDQTFPAAGISEELGADWCPLHIQSASGSGDRPILVRASRSTEIFNTVFPRARRAAIQLQKGRRVAVLCASEALFKKYATAGEYQDFFLPITDREQLSSLRHAGKRFVFSMPEYVAGIQFDTVFLIEVNDGEVQQGPYSTGALRRFVSLIYLGASRAERALEIYSSQERGGPSRALRHAINEGAIDVVDIRDLN